VTSPSWERRSTESTTRRRKADVGRVVLRPCQRKDLTGLQGDHSVPHTWPSISSALPGERRAETARTSDRRPRRSDPHPEDASRPQHALRTPRVPRAHSIPPRRRTAPHASGDRSGPGHLIRSLVRCEIITRQERDVRDGKRDSTFVPAPCRWCPGPDPDRRDRVRPAEHDQDRSDRAGRHGQRRARHDRAGPCEPRDDRQGIGAPSRAGQHAMATPRAPPTDSSNNHLRMAIAAAHSAHPSPSAPLPTPISFSTFHAARSTAATSPFRAHDT
jgi:hypothetical protein